MVFSLVYRRGFLTKFGGTFFAGSFPGLFFLGQGENTPGKNPAETQSIKIQVKSGEIPVRKNVKTMQSQYSKCNHSKQGKKFEDIKK